MPSTRAFVSSLESLCRFTRSRRRGTGGRQRLALTVLAVGVGWGSAAAQPERAEPARRFEEIRRFEAAEARQAVAVDAEYVYTIDNTAIGKYDKRTGAWMAGWSQDADGPLTHLNSGVVIDGMLYCAHSNYPGVPMVSSIEWFDTETLTPRGSHSFGIGRGSATWIDRREGRWWVGFAHYDGQGGEPGKGPAWTRVVLFDEAWREVGGYVFPPEVVERFAGRSNSGAAFGPDALLYATGHDAAEVYALAVPAQGSVLELREIIPVTAEGQGVAWDPSAPDVFYTILRSMRTVVISKVTKYE